MNIKIHSWLSFLILMTILLSGCHQFDKTKFLLITGGKKYERDSFLEMFDSFQSIEFDELIHPVANDIYTSPKINDYGVIVYYDFVQEINENQKNAMIDVLKKGKNVLFLHHSLACYQDWDEYEQIIGGRYIHSKGGSDSMTQKSTYRHDVIIPVTIADTNHPVTAGISNFEIQDEVYNNYRILPTVSPLLTTDHPENEKLLGWIKTYGNSKIVYIQLGHEHHAFEDKNYRQLVEQSITWLSSKN